MGEPGARHAMLHAWMAVGLWLTPSSSEASRVSSPALRAAIWSTVTSVE
jgi:hypothetical protein